MQKYIALLRGINVSSQKIMPMNDLKQLFEESGFQNVQTYIQSGNVIFDSNTSIPSELAEAIKNSIRKKFGFEVNILIRTPDEFRKIISENPFLNDYGKDTERMYVTFLAEEPVADRISSVQDNPFNPEEIHYGHKVIYLYSPNGYGRAKLNNNFLESRLKVKATTRKWKTVKKLLELASSNT